MIMSFSGKVLEPAIAAISVYFAEQVASRIAEDEALDVRVWDSAAMSYVRPCRLSSCMEVHSSWNKDVVSLVRTDAVRMDALIPSEER